MKTILLLLLLFIFTMPDYSIAQNAPITTAPMITACPGTTINIPITVADFSNIGAVSLNLVYNSSVLTNPTAATNISFPGLSVYTGTMGVVVAAGIRKAGQGVTLPNSTVLFTLHFTYTGGTTALSWYDNGESCEYADGDNNIPLNDIPQSTYFIDGQVSPMLIADFTVNNYTPEVNNPVFFSDISTGNPTGWNWAFTPSSYTFLDGTNAFSQNPHVRFTVNGSYGTSLTITKNTCSDTKNINDYIHAGTPGLWTGITSTDWNTNSNWHNYLIPDKLIDVVIPPSSPNWPLFNGNLINGTDCKSISLGVINILE